MKGTSVHIYNTWIKQLCNQKVWDFAMSFQLRKVFGTFRLQDSFILGVPIQHSASNWATVFKVMQIPCSSIKQLAKFEEWEMSYKAFILYIWTHRFHLNCQWNWPMIVITTAALLPAHRLIRLYSLKLKSEPSWIWPYVLEINHNLYSVTAEANCISVHLKAKCTPPFL